MPFMRDRSITTPPSLVPCPGALWPPPRTETRTPSDRAKLTVCWTSAAPRHRTIRAGRRSTLPFQTRRASSYLASPATTSSPRTLRRRLSMSASVRVVPVPSSVLAAIVMLMALQIGGFEVYQAPRALRRALGLPSHDSLISLVYSSLRGLGALRGAAGVLPGPRNFARHWFLGRCGASFAIMERWQLRQACRPRRSPMRKTFVAITAFALVPLGAAGCVSKSEYTKTVQAAEARYNALDTENARIKGELADAGKRNEQLTADRTQLERTLTMKSGELGQRVSALEGDNARLTKELAEAQKAREEKVREVSSTYEQLVAKMKGEIDKGQVKPEGLVVLGKVIEILKTVSDKSIRIEGHTDNKPIVGTLTQRYPTNWELSAARAINVASYLQKQAIEPATLSAAAFGEFKPVADNTTPEGRATNRRIEI